MKIILLKNINKLGIAGEIKEVSPGYANNYLFPQGLAKPVTARLIKEEQTRKIKTNLQQKQEAVKINKLRGRIKNLKLVIPAKANEKGNLFASLKEKDVLEYLRKENIDLSSFTLQVPSIKALGVYRICVKFNKSVQDNFTVKVVSD